MASSVWMTFANSSCCDIWPSDPQESFEIPLVKRPEIAGAIRRQTVALRIRKARMPLTAAFQVSSDEAYRDKLVNPYSFRFLNEPGPDLLESFQLPRGV